MAEKSKPVSILSGEHMWPSLLDPFRHLGQTISNFLSPSAEAVNTENAYEISVELPGVAEKDIDISLEDGLLTVKGEKRSEREEKDENYYFSERRYGSFQRAFRLPENIKEDDIHAKFKDGVLTVSLPKAEPKKPSGRKIAVKTE